MSRIISPAFSFDRSLKSLLKLGFFILVSCVLTASISAQCTKKKTREMINQGNESFKAKDFNSALNFYQKAVRNEPNCSLAYYNLGQTQRFTNQIDAAIGSLERALNLNYPDKAANYLALATAYNTKNQNNNSKELSGKALANAVNAIKINDKLLEAWVIIANANRQLGDSQAELNAWEQIIRLSPNDYAAKREKAFLLYRLKEFDQSIVEFEQLAKFEPNNPYNFLALSDLYRLTDKNNQAMEMATRAAALKSNSPDVAFTLGSSYLALKSYVKAIESFQAAINLKTQFLPESYFYIASAQIAQGKYTEALANLKQVGQTPPKLYPAANFNQYVYKAFAVCYGQLADFNQAINYLNQIKNDNLADDAGIYIDLSSWYSLLGEDEKALEAATQAINKDSTNSLGYTNRCRANYVSKKLAAAEQDCKRALELNPNDGETLFYYSRILRDTNRKKEADAMNKKAINLLEKSIGVKTANAEIVAKEVKNQKPVATDSAYGETNYLYSVNVISPYTPYILGNAYFDDNQLNKAVNAYKLSLQRAPRFPLAHLNLGIVYFIQRDKKSALAQYDELTKIDGKRAQELKKIIDGK